MALYLGSEKLGVTIPVYTEGTSNIKCATGTITSQADGTILFPELNFTPKMIAVWNVEQVDLAEEEGLLGEWDESSIRYIQRGIMLFAIFEQDMWFSQVAFYNSDSIAMAISGDQADLDGDYEADNLPYGAQAISIIDNRYCYHLHKRAAEIAADMEFNYAIYG